MELITVSYSIQNVEKKKRKKKTFFNAPRASYVIIQMKLQTNLFETTNTQNDSIKFCVWGRMG